MVREVSDFVKVVGKRHGECILRCLQESWENNQFSNVTIICRDQINQHNVEGHLFANKFVLAAASKKLARLLDGIEDDVVMIVPDYDRSTFKLLLEYVHSGRVYLNTPTEELQNLLREWDINVAEIIPAGQVGEKSESVSIPAAESGVKYVFVEERVSIANDIARKNSVKSTSAYPNKGAIKAQSKIQANFPESVPNRGENNSIDNNISPSKKTDKIKKKPGHVEAHAEYVFLETYMKNSKKKATEITEENDTADSKPENTIKLLNSKKKFKKVSDALPIADETYEKADCEDLSSSIKLLEEEKKINLEMIENIADLTETVQRYKIYVRHLIGVEINEDKTIDKTVAKIPCETCGKMVSKDYMIHHVKIHTTERPYLCDQCGQTFALRCRLRVHQRFQHSELTFHVCTICEKSFKKAAYLQRHMTLHEGLKPYACKYCDSKFRLPNVLSKHIRTHTGERPYECEICQKRFGSRSTYVNHTLTHKKNSPLSAGFNFDPVTQLLKCDVCQLTFHREYAYILHKAGHTGETPALPCAHCDAFFASLKLLRQHTKECHADALYSCDKCDGKFANKTSLYAHALIHKHGKRFACDQCEKSFTTKSQHCNHMKSMHSEERPFSCQWCEKTFKSKVTLRQHARTHTDERPYKCPKCPKAFRQGQHLACHLVLHTGEKPYICQYCAKSFSHKNNLNSHIKIHTGERNQCKTCGRIFPSVVKLRRHENTHLEETAEIAHDRIDNTTETMQQQAFP